MQRQAGVQEALAKVPHRLLLGEVERPHLQLALAAGLGLQWLQRLLGLLGIAGACGSGQRSGLRLWSVLYVTR